MSCYNFEQKELLSFDVQVNSKFSSLTISFHLNAVKSDLIEKKFSKPLIQRSIDDYLKK